MPEFIHNFTQGKMNHDLDERMIPNGQYRDALNVTVSTSESSNVGALQNLKGNTQLKKKGVARPAVDWSVDYIDALTNPKCIGTIRNEPTECIYWFIASDASGTSDNGVSVIAEFNQKTGIVKPVLVDTFGILNFSTQYLITGINIVDNLLFWTDDQYEPKKINLDKFKKGSIDFTTHTKIPNYSTSTGVYSYSSTGALFNEADVTVIKKSPLDPPGLTMSATAAGGPGTGTDPVTTTYSTNNYYNFTYITEAASGDSPAEYAPLPTYQTYLEAVGTADAYPTNMETFTIVTSQAPTGWVVGDIIVLEGSELDDYNNNNEYTIRLEIDFINNQSITCKIQSIPSTILRFGSTGSDLIVWEVLLEEQDPMFEFDFPRFAYRWKYENGEYSCFSPFSQVAFLGSTFEYLSSDGFNEGMKNNLRSLDITTLNWGSEEVIELDVLFKNSTSNNIYIVDTLKDRTVTTLNIKNELIGATVEANQLLRPWDNVPRKAKAQEVSANRLIYANYIQNFDVPKITTQLTASLNSIATVNQPQASIKSIRNYQLGIVLQDAYGRQTPVFTSPSATVTIDKSNSSGVSKLLAQSNIPDSIPDWVTHYKYFIKDISNQYYNLALDRFYFAEDGNVWLSFPSSEVSKVQIDSYLILKKQHDVSSPSVGPCRYKVLDVKSEPPEFISRSKKIIASAVVEAESGFQQDFSVITFKGPDADDNAQFAVGFNGDSFITVADGGNVSDIYGVKFGGPTGSSDGYSVTLDDAFGADTSFFGAAGLPAGSTVQLNIYKEEIERLPEFEGRFFVKINRDTDFEVNIVKTFLELKKRFGIVAAVDCGTSNGIVLPTASTNVSGNDSRKKFNYIDPGEENTLSCNSAWRRKGIDTGGNGAKLDNSVTNGDGNAFNGWTWDEKGLTPANSQPWSDASNFRTKYYAGAKTNRKFIGIGNIGDNQDIATMRVVMGAAAPFMLDKAVKGALVRIQHIDGRVTQPYEIVNHWRWKGRRGRRSKSGCNNQKGSGYNRMTAIALELKDPISEDWIGNGSAAALVSIKGFQIVEEIISDDNKILSSNNPAVFETEPKEAVDIDIYYEASKAFNVSDINTPKYLDYFNCYSFGNGVESDRIRDDFNAPIIGKGVKVSTILDEPYMEERRGSGLIFSQIYNSTSGINRLNQFIQAQPITKDLNPEYGSIQKLFSKNTNLVTLCEDKCLSILANKDALFNADGSTNITSNKAVLGAAQPYAGEFGISKNPESFADYGFRSYFSDKNRGAVIRLSQDGITNIALKGMTDFFADNLPVCTNIIGSYNDDKENYNITLDNLTAEWGDQLSATPKDKTHCEVVNDLTDDIKSTTVSFKETVNGWVSRKSYYNTTGGIVYPLENGVSINDKYYTFNKGLIWEHHSNETYNNFYGQQYDSSFNVVINEATESIKGFKTLNYSGTASKQYSYNTSTGLTGLSIEQVIAQQITPSTVNAVSSTAGWYTNWIQTDIEDGAIKEFVKKENKYFNRIKGVKTYYTDNCDNNVDTSDFPTQGLGTCVVGGGATTSYNLTVTIDPSCCTDLNQPNLTSKFFWNWVAKGSNKDIRVSTPQNAKCIIEEFYNLYSNNFDTIDKFHSTFKSYSSSSLATGTLIFDENDNQLTTLTGTYLYAGSDSTPSNAALNANVTGTSVPNTYLIIVITNGVITSRVQYNTLNACGTPEPNAEIFTQTATLNLGTSLNWNTAFSGTAAAGRAAAAKTGIVSYLAPYANCGGGSYNKQVKYLASGGVAVGASLYDEDGVSFGSADGLLVYNTAQTWNGYNYINGTIPKSYLLSNATWATIPSTYKFITYENGVITHITQMNTL